MSDKEAMKQPIPDDTLQEISDPYMVKRGFKTIEFAAASESSTPPVSPSFARAFVDIYKSQLATRLLGLPDFDPPKAQRKVTKKKPG